MARKKTKLSTEINVVPYIDVMLVLLIIFMITAPLLEQGVDVDLPSTHNNSKVELPNKEHVFLVSIKEDGTIHASFSGDTMVVNEELLVSRASDFVSQNSNSKAFLRADKNVRYESVMTTMDLLKSSGYEKVGLISKQE